MVNWQNCWAVEWVPDWLGGVWVFKGTRLPIRFLFEYLSAGGTVNGFAKWYGLDDANVVAVLAHGTQQLCLRRPAASNIVADQYPTCTDRNEPSRKAEFSASEGWRGRVRSVSQVLILLTILGAVILAVFAFLAVAFEAQENTIHAALVAMCASAVLIVQPFGWVWLRTIAPQQVRSHWQAAFYGSPKMPRYLSRLTLM